MDYGSSSAYRGQEYSQEQMFSDQEQMTDFEEECSNSFDLESSQHLNCSQKNTEGDKQSLDHRGVNQVANEHSDIHLREEKIAHEIQYFRDTSNSINYEPAGDYCDLENTPPTEFDLTPSIKQDYVGDCSSTMSESDSLAEDGIKSAYDVGPFDEYV